MKRWLILLLALVMMFSVVGCSGGDEKAQPAPQERAQDTDSGDAASGTAPAPTPAADPSDGDFLEILSMFDLATHFKEFNFTYTSNNQLGERITDHSITVLDEKMIDGKQAYQILYTRLVNEEESIIECWVNQEQVLEAIKDGETVEDEMGLAMVELSLGTFMMNFAGPIMYQGLLMEPAIAEFMGLELVEEGTKAGNLANVSSNLKYYLHKGEEERELYFEIADIGGKAFFVNYTNVNQEGHWYDFETTHLVPR